MERTIRWKKVIRRKEKTETSEDGSGKDGSVKSNHKFSIRSEQYDKSA